MKPFTVKCNKCGSEDVLLFAEYDGSVSLVCNGKECDNECEEYDLRDGDESE